MIINSVSKAIGKPQFAGQIKGKFQTVLLNQPLPNSTNRTWVSNWKVQVVYERTELNRNNLPCVVM